MRVDLIERHCAEAYEAERVVPCAEVHLDSDVAWVVHSGSTWRNSAIMVRMSPATVVQRLDTMLERYKRHGRGMGVWVSPLSTPENLSELLAARRLNCRKRFPAMVRVVTRSSSLPDGPLDVEIRTLTAALASPRAMTPRARCELQRVQARLADPLQRTRVFDAWIGDTAVGRIELFIGRECAGIHGLSVDEHHQGRGIGSALLERACHEAAHAGTREVVLLATTQGQRVYERRGFEEVARFAYWYRSFQRGRAGR